MRSSLIVMSATAARTRALRQHRVKCELRQLHLPTARPVRTVPTERSYTERTEIHFAGEMNVVFFAAAPAVFFAYDGDEKLCSTATMSSFEYRKRSSLSQSTALRRSTRHTSETTRVSGDPATAPSSPSIRKSPTYPAASSNGRWSAFTTWQQMCSFATMSVLLHHARSREKGTDGSAPAC